MHPGAEGDERLAGGSGSMLENRKAFKIGRQIRQPKPAGSKRGLGLIQIKAPRPRQDTLLKHPQVTVVS
jgi:hypothetical protein